MSKRKLKAPELPFDKEFEKLARRHNARTCAVLLGPGDNGEVSFLFVGDFELCQMVSGCIRKPRRLNLWGRIKAAWEALKG